MKALILNSGTGHRMGAITKLQPKCMTEIAPDETILSRQLKMLQVCGVHQVVITTGMLDEMITEYCASLGLDLEYFFVKNPIYDKTNYIYSIYCAKDFLDDDIIMLHGDLVFDVNVLKSMLNSKESLMAVNTITPLPEKDFKAVVKEGMIQKVGIEFFEGAIEAQPLYKLNKVDWKIWLNQIEKYCVEGIWSCYAENALNDVTDRCHISMYDVGMELCGEIDTLEDLQKISERLEAEK